MKRVLIMALLLVVTISLALTKGLPKEKEVLMPHTSASPAVETHKNEKVIPLGANMAMNGDKDIRIIKKGDGYVLQIKHADLSVEEYELKSDKKPVTRSGL